MSPGAALVLLVIGVLVFLQVTVGGAVARIRSYETDQAVDDGGPRSSAFVPSRFGGKALRVARGVVRGDPIVYNTIMPAAMAAGGGFTVISWVRPGSDVRGDPRNPSCHRGGKGDGYGALDMIPPRDKRGRPQWERADRLVTELRQTPGVTEIVFRGDSDHDPALKASTPHVHAAVGCG